jgi:hypothetical protein
VNPSDCFVALWRFVEGELARGHSKRGTVTYHAGIGIEGGKYRWNGGLPQVVLWRKDRAPPQQEEPDLATQPLLDACLLAHEYGHFLSDREGERTKTFYEAISTGRALPPEAQEAVLVEEARAWELGRQALTYLGCTEWSDFDGYRDHFIETYREGLAKLEAAGRSIAAM